MSCPQFLTHISVEGDRWDLLAWIFYGDPTLFGPIIMANPLIPIEAVLSAGLAIYVPVVQKSSIVTADLPPWKQSNS